MLLAEQLPELLTETALGAFAHLPDLSHQRVRVDPDHGRCAASDRAVAARSLDDPDDGAVRSSRA